MNVLFFTVDYKPMAGGIAEHTHRLARELHDRGDGVAVLAPAMDGDRAFDADQPFPVHRAGAPDPGRSSADGRRSGRSTSGGTLEGRSSLAGLLPDGAARVVESLADRGRLAAALPALVHRYDVDWVYCPMWFPTGAVAVALGHAMDYATAIAVHAHEVVYSRATRKKRAARRLRPVQARVLGDAEAVVAVSEYTRSRLLDLGVPSHLVHVVNNGVDPDRFDVDDRPPLDDLLSVAGQRPVSTAPARGEGGGGDGGPIGGDGPDRETDSGGDGHRSDPGGDDSGGGDPGIDLDDPTVLLTVARLDPRKGHDVVIRALPAVVERVPDAVYLVAGGGDDARVEQLRSLAREVGVADRVAFLGHVPDDRLPALYDAADLFVMPNRREGTSVEGFGIVFLEANAAGTAVVGGDHGGARDAVADGESGLLVDPEDPAAVARAVGNLLTDADRRERIARQGRRRVRESYTWSDAADRLRTILRYNR